MTTLNKDQTEAFKEIVYNRKNVFVTSAAGCGKSFLLKYIYKFLSKTYNVALTSLTGISAYILDGQTLHSYLGIRLGTGSFENLLNLVRYNKFVLNRWKRLDVLIIDEISMLDIILFEKLEKIARFVRKNEKPFGGIQIVFSGDFLQLPAVKTDKFCFESEVWGKCVDKIIVLTEIMRQTDIKFIETLNKIRIGDIDDDCKELIESREIKYISKTGLIPTMLYATNNKVDKTNDKYYRNLESEEYTYKISYTWKQNTFDKEKYENMTKLPYELNLKIGAQVMHLVNNNDLVNGSRGVITNFIEGYPLVLFSDGVERIITSHSLDIEENDKIIMSYSQIPLKLAWAISIHKSQGCTLTLVRVDCKNIFEYGQLYVALSRCASLEGLYIRNMDWNRCKQHPKALEFYKKIN